MIPPMVQRLPAAYVFDPDDPRAPAVDQWDRMSPEERARVVAMLPAEVPLELEVAAKLAEAQRRRAETERQLAEALAEIERLKKGGS